jgi:ubiquinone/menaquinone biosynthesis C-methylase UbiE
MPAGLMGRVMLRIMNNAHHSLATWGVQQLRPTSTVLDVSCGGGSAIAMMADSGKFGRIFGIDVSSDSIVVATAKNRKHIAKGVVDVRQASVLALPFEDEAFDAAITIQSHYHWPETLQAAREVYRVLRPSGLFVVVAETYKIEYHMKEYNSIAGTHALLEDAGFVDIELLSSACW